MKGVYLDRKSGKYKATIHHLYESHRLGTYMTEQEAIDAVEKYMKQFEDPKLDVNILARDHIAWAKKSESVLKHISEKYEVKL